MKARINQSFSTRMCVQDKSMALCLFDCENTAPDCLSGRSLGYLLFSHVVAHNRRYALFRRSASKDEIKGCPPKWQEIKTMNKIND